MRLSKMKMSGFKSFVDPTTIDFPSDMVGIVGPNGCGKSNTIDAVRWVMGESSKHIRGDTMEDVIFSGSNTRKPVGQASIELIFDNSDGQVGGQYAQYNEISIRRSVSRDGQSKYYLNGVKCRRRDITDIFMGTGLGPRSYAIIEQGMISRLIEAKPEELRVYLEEAAGISKYKERRRETENRIRHTRENLSRLNDLREEIEKQLEKLQRQAKTAEKYKELKESERQLRAELLALRWQHQDEDVRAREQKVKEKETRFEEVVAELREIETAIEKSRVEHAEANESFNKVQGEYYKLGSDISRVEQSIQHNKAMHERQQEERQQVQQALEGAQQAMREDRERLVQLDKDIADEEPALQTLQAEQERQEAQRAEAEQAMAAWQQEWEDLNQRAAEPQQAAQVERTRIEHLERQITQLAERRERLAEEHNSISTESLQSELENLGTLLSQVKGEADSHQQNLQNTLDTINQQRSRNQELGHQLDVAREKAQTLRGRLASLEALQEAALGKQQEAVSQWLGQQGLTSAPRLAETLDVESGWERAVETVLGQYLEAVCTDDVDAVADALGRLEHGSLVLLDSSASSTTPQQGRYETLLGKLRSPGPATDLLEGVYVVSGLQQALDMRGQLSAGESVVTSDGVWLGKNWLRVARDADEHAGVIARESEIKSLAQELQHVDESVNEIEQQLQQGRQALSEQEAAREELQVEHNRVQRLHAQAQARVDHHRNQFEQVNARRMKLADELAEIKQQYEHDSLGLQEATAARNQALEQMNLLGDQRDVLSGKREGFHNALKQSREQLQAQRIKTHELALKLGSMQTARTETQQALQRMEEQLGHLQQRSEDLQGLIQQSLAPIEGQEAELKELLSQRVSLEQSLTESRTRVQDLDATMREQEQSRVQIEQRINEVRTEVERLRMAWQEANVRGQTLKEQLDESGFELEALFASLEEGAAPEAWEERLEKLVRRIERLGPINLAAIEEFEEQSKRKEYLDKQNDDLIEALETLENAIRKIDKETRSRFKETYELVNTRLQEMFPRLFGGGNAHLELTGDDLLTTGVAIFARPPGKRLSSIHLMSGGEKALTAVAMVFAIFELNPAPFCMLDEVDAPLDEANVGRFCELVKDMSSRVQFIFITHNKSTMEYAEQLIGVTMNEPGVSRLVAVDVDEAARMATG